MLGGLEGLPSLAYIQEDFTPLQAIKVKITTTMFKEMRDVIKQ
jgi:hypothetical protein